MKSVGSNLSARLVGPRLWPAWQVWSVRHRIAPETPEPAASHPSTTCRSPQVEYCVDRARQWQPGELQRDLHSRFDAFYNSATKLVENNATWDQAAVFAFNKCMAQQGPPLAHRYPPPWDALDIWERYR